MIDNPRQRQNVRVTWMHCLTPENHRTIAFGPEGQENIGVMLVMPPEVRDGLLRAYEAVQEAGDIGKGWSFNAWVVWTMRNAVKKNNRPYLIEEYERVETVLNEPSEEET